LNPAKEGKRMIRIFSLAGGLGLSLAIAAPAMAQAIDADVKCMLTSNFFARAEKDAARQKLAVVTGSYYFGRADARLSAAQLKAQLIAAGKSQIKPAELPPIMNDCAKRFQERDRALQEIGKSIMPPPAPGAKPTNPAPTSR
jgi:hypothetical protein